MSVLVNYLMSAISCLQELRTVTAASLALGFLGPGYVHFFFLYKANVLDFIFRIYITTKFKIFNRPNFLIDNAGPDISLHQI